jgi:hypothetical protein
MVGVMKHGAQLVLVPVVGPESRISSNPASALTMCRLLQAARWGRTGEWATFQRQKGTIQGIRTAGTGPMGMDALLHRFLLRGPGPGVTLRCSATRAAQVLRRLIEEQ